MVELVRQIDKALYNPMWEQVRAPAPWDNPANTWQARAMAQIEAEAAALAADPVRAEEVRRAAKVCQCKGVSLGEIEDSIHAHALTTVEGVREHTSASGGCGACSVRVEDILARLATEQSNAPLPVAAE
jgi:nitrogenase molybdenum-cofactor synthesis protein NifE